MHTDITNIIVAGLGGQGVLTASDILAKALVRAGFEVKKSEIKGMSQRGGSVTSDVRFGRQVFSPMVPAGEANYLLVLEPGQVEANRHMLRCDATVIGPDAVDASRLTSKKELNVALLGALSAHLPVAEGEWLDALREQFAPEFFAANRAAFLLGRECGRPDSIRN